MERYTHTHTPIRDTERSIQQQQVFKYGKSQLAKQLAGEFVRIFGTYVYKHVHMRGVLKKPKFMGQISLLRITHMTEIHSSSLCQRRQLFFSLSLSSHLLLRFNILSSRSQCNEMAARAGAGAEQTHPSFLWPTRLASNRLLLICLLADWMAIAFILYWQTQQAIFALIFSLFTFDTLTGFSWNAPPTKIYQSGMAFPTHYLLVHFQQKSLVESTDDF